MTQSFCKAEKKRRFRDDISAKMAIMKISRHSQRDKLPTRAYKCDHCRGYHLTSQPKRSTVIDSK